MVEWVHRDGYLAVGIFLARISLVDDVVAQAGFQDELPLDACVFRGQHLVAAVEILRLVLVFARRGHAGDLLLRVMVLLVWPSVANRLLGTRSG